MFSSPFWACWQPHSCFFCQLQHLVFSPSTFYFLFLEFWCLPFKKLLQWDIAVKQTLIWPVQLNEYLHVNTPDKAVEPARHPHAPRPHHHFPLRPHPIFHIFDCRWDLSFLDFHMNGIIQYVLFCAWLFSFNIMFLRLIHVVACQ